MSVTNYRNAIHYYNSTNLTVLEAANSIAAGLRERKNDNSSSGSDDEDLIRIRKGGDMRKSVTPLQAAQGRNKGSALQRSCFICKIYHPKARHSSFMCKYCGTCVCKVDRGRGLSCIKEHRLSTDPRISCDRGNAKTVFPKELRKWQP